MKCKRCGQDIEADAPANVTVCGSCADDLRQEEDAEIESIALADKARQEQAAYEDYKAEEQFRHMDDGGGWRYC
jgi:ribosome-binding protein aMBF1 (putative translation factor)